MFYKRIIFPEHNKIDLNVIIFIIKMFFCEECGKECKTKCGYTKHRTFCMKNQEFICLYCKENFSNKRNVTRHIEEKSCKEYIRFIEKELEHYKQLFEKEHLEHQELTQSYNSLSTDNKQTMKELQNLIQKDKDNSEHLKQKDFQIKLEQDLVKKLQNDLQRQIEETTLKHIELKNINDIKTSNKSNLMKFYEEKNHKEYISFIEQNLKEKDSLLVLQKEQIKKLTNENQTLSKLYQNEKLRSDDINNHYKQLSNTINLLHK